jgi:hypothetical protein
MARGKNIDKEYSPSTPPAKVEQLIAWPRREKMKTRGKNKDTGGKIKTEGEKISFFPPVEILSSDTVTKKDCVQGEKYDLISLLQYFPPSTQSVRVEQLLHGLRGKK